MGILDSRNLFEIDMFQTLRLNSCEVNTFMISRIPTGISDWFVKRPISTLMLHLKAIYKH
jgi:hypothetical protein